ncbi:MAG: hypothetical protein II873_07840 [Oscillospiraceae bacterium]|nr:hypothetical protein [Oscillospiraceae bacterium]
MYYNRPRGTSARGAFVSGQRFLQGAAGIREEWYTDENTEVEVEWIPLSMIDEAPIERIERQTSGREPESESDP